MGSPPGGHLRVFGRSLAFDAQGCISDGPNAAQRAPIFDWEDTAPVRTRMLGGALASGVAAKLVPIQVHAQEEVALDLDTAACYALTLAIPPTATPGAYYLVLNNGLDAGWSLPVRESGETALPAVVTITSRIATSANTPVSTASAQPALPVLVAASCSSITEAMPPWCAWSRNTGSNLSAALLLAAKQGGAMIRLLPGETQCMRLVQFSPFSTLALFCNSLFVTETASSIDIH